MKKTFCGSGSVKRLFLTFDLQVIRLLQFR